MPDATSPSQTLIDLQNALLVGLTRGASPSNQLVYKRRFSDGREWMIFHSISGKDSSNSVIRMCDLELVITNRDLESLPPDTPQDVIPILEDLLGRLDTYLREGEAPGLLYLEFNKGERERWEAFFETLKVFCATEEAHLRVSLASGWPLITADVEESSYQLPLKRQTHFGVTLTNFQFMQHLPFHRCVTLDIAGKEHHFFSTNLDQLPDDLPRPARELLKLILERAFHYQKNGKILNAFFLEEYPDHWKWDIFFFRAKRFFTSLPGILTVTAFIAVLLKWVL